MIHPLFHLIRQQLTEDLRDKIYRDLPFPTGFCYIATEALWYLLGDKNYTPCHLSIDGDTHWFLRHKNGSILDPTADQYFRTPDYSQGRGCGFLTNYPSKKAQKIINGVRGQL